MQQALAESIRLFEAGLENCHQSEDRSNISHFLAELGPLLAAVVLEIDILSRLARIERLFGQAWLIDQEPFEPAFARWREFKTEYEKFAVRGMTVNERLYALSLLEGFDQAVEEKNFAEIRRILEAAHVDEDSIAQNITNIRGAA